jgi:hypothetical protein
MRPAKTPTAKGACITITPLDFPSLAQVYSQSRKTIAAAPEENCGLLRLFRVFAAIE